MEIAPFHFGIKCENEVLLLKLFYSFGKSCFGE